MSNIGVLGVPKSKSMSKIDRVLGLPNSKSMSKIEF